MWTIDNRLRQTLAARRITFAELSLATGVGVTRLRRAAAPGADPAFRLARGIAAALDQRVEALFALRWEPRP